jgi:hypothetical protein
MFMEEPAMTAEAKPQTKPKRSRPTRATKPGTTKGQTTAAGNAPKPQADPAPLERVPVPEMPQSRPARTPKFMASMVVPVANAETPAIPPEVLRSEALKILVDHANQGSKSALAKLRELMNKCPEIWIHLGDLSKHAELAWTDLIAGGDHLIMESVKKYVERLKSELAGPEPSPIERLLAEQAALTWLASRQAEAAAAKPGPSSLGEAKMRLKRAESAQRRYLASLKALEELRAHNSRKG